MSEALTAYPLTVPDGLTIREVLEQIRNVRWGDIDTATVPLTDGTTIEVELLDYGHGTLLGSQRIVRRTSYQDGERIIRTYSW